MFSPKIVVVENEEIFVLDIRNWLQKLGSSTLERTISEEEVLQKIVDMHPSVVLISTCLSEKNNNLKNAGRIENALPFPAFCLAEYSEVTQFYKNQTAESHHYTLRPGSEKNLHIALEIALYKHHTEKKLREEKRKFTTIFKSMGYAVVVTDAKGHIQMMNQVAEALTAWKQEEAVAKGLAEVLKLVDKDTREAVEDLPKQVVQEEAALPLPDNCTLMTKDGKDIQIEGSIASIRDDNGNINGTVLVFQDITQRKQVEAQLIRNAFYDALTALPNRVLFLDRLKQAFERSKRRNNYRFAVLFLDLDGFKSINDSFGHSMGDDLLVEIARRLESCLRGGDTVARFGGDEFAILLEDIQDISDAINVAKRIQESLKLPLHLNGHQISIAASIGIALSCSGYEEPSGLLRDADVAMYRAKEQGKAQYVVFNFQQSLVTND